jgi:hypothetical protein
MVQYNWTWRLLFKNMKITNLFIIIITEWATNLLQLQRLELFPGLIINLSCHTLKGSSSSNLVLAAHNRQCLVNWHHWHDWHAPPWNTVPAWSLATSAANNRNYLQYMSRVLRSLISVLMQTSSSVFRATRVTCHGWKLLVVVVVVNFCRLGRLAIAVCDSVIAIVAISGN